MSELARQSGCDTYAITDGGGEVWHFSSVETGDAAGELDNFAANRYRLEAQQIAAGMPAEVWGATLASAAAKINAGHFKFGGPAMVELMAQEDYRAELVRLALKPKHPDITAARAKAILRDRTREVYAALVATNPNTFGQPAAGDGGPKGGRPVARAKASPTPSAS